MGVGGGVKFKHALGRGKIEIWDGLRVIG